MISIPVLESAEGDSIHELQRRIESDRGIFTVTVDIAKRHHDMETIGK